MRRPSGTDLVMGRPEHWGRIEWMITRSWVLNVNAEFSRHIPPPDDDMALHQREGAANPPPPTQPFSRYILLMPGGINNFGLARQRDGNRRSTLHGSGAR